MLTTNQKGAIAEAAVMQEAIDLGLGVWLPFAEEPYDLILDLRPGLLRVQCKQAVLRGDVINIGTCVAAAIGTDCSSASTSRTRSTSSRPTAPIPTAATCSRTSCRSTGRLEPAKNNQVRGIRWARDYEFRATLTRIAGPIAQLGERVAGSHEVAGSSPAGSIRMFPLGSACPFLP